MVCDKCAGTKDSKKKSLGWFSFLSTKMKGKVDDKIRAIRLSMCRACMEREVTEDGRLTNKRLFQNVEKVVKGEVVEIPHCGKPRGFFDRRNEYREGCGCNLLDKTSYTYSECPRKKWGPKEFLGRGILIEQVRSTVKRLKDTIDLHPRCKNRPSDCNGIGDLFCNVQIANSLKLDNPDKRIRIATIKRNYDWLRLVWPIEDIVYEGSLEKGEDERHPVIQGWIPNDKEAEEKNENRIQCW